MSKLFLFLLLTSISLVGKTYYKPNLGTANAEQITSKSGIQTNGAEKLKYFDQKKDSITTLEEFDWIVSKVINNYSGFGDKVKNYLVFKSFTDSIRALVSNAVTIEKAEPLLQSWLSFFKDSHLSIRLRKTSSPKEITADTLNSKFVYKQLDNKSSLMVIPSFNIKYKHIIDSLLTVNESTIHSLNNMIIDIRNNGGGSDESFGKLIPFLYTNPIIRINSDIWATEDNIKKFELVAADKNYSLATRKEMADFVLKLKQNKNQFVSRGDDDTLRITVTDSLPQKVYIIINGNVASSAEGFLLKAIQSKKVVLVGQHTKGELDYANVNYLISPHKKISLGCPTSRSRRLPEMPIDNIGIAPDVFLSADKDWVEYTVQRIDDFEFNPARFFIPLQKRINIGINLDELKDTSKINLDVLAKSIVRNTGNSIVSQVQRVVQWTNMNFEWTGNDYKNRTVKEIIARGGGLCSEQTRVTRDLLNRLGIKTRSISEINIQPDDSSRQMRAEAKVKEFGSKMSVFGLNHNDHVWIEYYDIEKNLWLPADPTLGLVGIESWLRARIGFDTRPTHSIIASRNMIVPIGIFARDGKTGKIIENRSEYYLVDQFNLVYGNKLEKLKEWEDWKRLILSIGNKCLEAFEGKTNLHEQNTVIGQIKVVYENLKKELKKG